MTTTTFDKYRPYSFQGYGIWNRLKGINYSYWLQRSPMFLLSLPAAYATSVFMGNMLAEPFNIFAGAGFESVYLGCVALADQLYDEDAFTTRLWWILNALAVLVSALINTLHASNSVFNGIHAESFVYGIPLPVLAFGYSLLLHRVTNKNAARDYKIEQEKQRIENERKQYELDNPHMCSCGSRFKNKAGLSSHKRRSCKDIA